MTIDDFVNQETLTNKLVQKAHNEIFGLKRLREMNVVRQCVFEDAHGCGTHFDSEVTECFIEIKWVIKKQIYKQIQKAIKEATEAYTTYCDMCKECNIDPKKFDMDFNYEID